MSVLLRSELANYFWYAGRLGQMLKIAVWARRFLGTDRFGQMYVDVWAFFKDIWAIYKNCCH